MTTPAGRFTPTHMRRAAEFARRYKGVRWRSPFYRPVDTTRLQALMLGWTDILAEVDRRHKDRRDD